MRSADGLKASLYTESDPPPFISPFSISSVLFSLSFLSLFTTTLYLSSFLSSHLHIFSSTDLSISWVLHLSIFSHSPQLLVLSVTVAMEHFQCRFKAMFDWDDCSFISPSAKENFHIHTKHTLRHTHQNFSSHVHLDFKDLASRICSCRAACICVCSVHACASVYVWTPLREVPEDITIQKQKLINQPVPELATLSLSPHFLFYLSIPPHPQSWLRQQWRSYTRIPSIFLCYIFSLSMSLCFTLHPPTYFPAFLSKFTLYFMIFYSTIQTQEKNRQLSDKSVCMVKKSSCSFSDQSGSNRHSLKNCSFLLYRTSAVVEEVLKNTPLQVLHSFLFFFFSSVKVNWH